MSFFIVLGIFFAAYWFWRKSNEAKQQASDPNAEMQALPEQALSYEQKVDVLMQQIAEQDARIEMLEEKLRRMELN